MTACRAEVAERDGRGADAGAHGFRRLRAADTFPTVRHAPRRGRDAHRRQQVSDMTRQPFYTARASVAKVDGIHRRATLEDGTEIDFGVHGPIKAHYRLDAEPDRPLPVDYLVAAAAG